MKKQLLWALIALLTFTLSSCDKDDTPDQIAEVTWYPIEIEIFVQNKDGVDLLNYETAYYVGNDFTLTYNGKVYRMELEASNVNPKLIWGKNNVKNRCIAYFGELEGDKEYNDDFILTWKDGTTDVIHFNRKIKDVLDTEDQWLFNGVDTKQSASCGSFTIIKQ